MIIALGNDHIVTDTKMLVSDFLKAHGHQVIDCGCHDFTRTHYPIYGKMVGECVASGEADLGVVMCGTGIGITNAVNKVPGARCALVRDMTTAVHAREKLGANVIGFGGRITGQFLIQDIALAFIEATPQDDPEIKKLIEKIDSVEHADSNQSDPHFFDDLILDWENGVYHD